MKTLSMYQPYAWLVVNGYTDIDDRTWPSNHKGELLIHASKKIDMRQYEYAKHVLGIDLPAPEAFDYGGIVGKVTMTGCLRPGEPTDVPAARRAHGGPHCYGFVFQDQQTMDFIPCRGMPGMFDVDLDQLMANDENPALRQGRMF